MVHFQELFNFSIFHLNFSDSGGPATVARSLVKEQKLLGLDTSFNFIQEDKLNLKSYSNFDVLIKTMVDNFIIKKKSTTSFFSLTRANIDKNTTFSTSNFNKSILHLHWTPGVMSISKVLNLSNRFDKIIWTLHDMWPITGGCHHSNNCTNFYTDCSNCPITLPLFHKSVQKSFAEKTQLGNLKNLYIVSPSNWLFKEAHQSGIFKNFKNIIHINNPVEVEAKSSKIYQNKLSRHENLLFFSNQDPLNIGFISRDLNDPNKGFHRFIDNINSLSDEIKSKINLIIVGNGNISLTTSKFNKFIKIPASRNSIDLQKHFEKIDILIVSSFKENQSILVLEAQASGIPVIGWEDSRIDELINHGFNGFIINKANFNEVIDNLILGKVRMNKLIINSRNYVESAHQSSVINDKYLNVYLRK
jgi:glycosyltransferase involved in cell wall biosynthesis